MLPSFSIPWMNFLELLRATVLCEKFHSMRWIDVELSTSFDSILGFEFLYARRQKATKINGSRSFWNRIIYELLSFLLACVQAGEEKEKYHARTMTLSHNWVWKTRSLSLILQKQTKRSTEHQTLRRVTLCLS